MEPVNPYQPSVSEMPQQERTLEVVAKARGRRFAWLWPLLFGVNLITPLMFATAITRGSGWIGVLVGVALFFWGGWMVGRASETNGTRLLLGASFLGVAQLLPFAQVFAGLFGFEVAQWLGAADLPSDESTIGGIATSLGGFVCTIVTGGLLTAAAFAIGAMLLLIGRSFVKWQRHDGRD